MNRNRVMSCFICSFLLTSSLACSGSKVVLREPLEVDLGPYTSVVVSGESLEGEDMEGEVSYLEQRVIWEIKNLDIFENVLLGTGTEQFENTLHIKLKVSKIRRVNGKSRSLLGAFAGQASVTTDILFVDAASGNPLGSYSVTGKSGGTASSGGTNDAVEKTAEGIAKIVSANFD